MSATKAAIIYVAGLALPPALGVVVDGSLCDVTLFFGVP